jgi:hypothetical protein
MEGEMATGDFKAQIGWICPVCGAGNAPWNQTCLCRGQSSFVVTEMPKDLDLNGLNLRPGKFVSTHDDGEDGNLVEDIK